MMCQAEAIILELQAKIEAVKLEVIAMQANDAMAADTGAGRYTEESYRRCARRVDELAEEISLYSKALPQRYPTGVIFTCHLLSGGPQCGHWHCKPATER